MQRSDEELLGASGSYEFALFYRRHAPALLGFFARRVSDAEAAADLTSETFAAAVVARKNFSPERGSATGWLYGIAAHKLIDYQRKGRLELRARKELGMARRPVSEEDIVEIEALGREIVTNSLSVLPLDQAEAIEAHVLAEASYDELALKAGVSPSAMRHRVSRGLATLRERMGERP